MPLLLLLLLDAIAVVSATNSPLAFTVSKRPLTQKLHLSDGVQSLGSGGGDGEPELRDVALESWFCDVWLLSAIVCNAWFLSLLSSTVFFKLTKIAFKWQRSAVVVVEMLAVGLR